MTKVIIFGSKGQPQTKKPIEFVGFLNDCMEWDYDITEKKQPRCFANIELICREYSEDKKDLMFAYDDNRNDENNAILFLGHFNDGVVE